MSWLRRSDPKELMGFKAGEYIAKLHPGGGEKVKVAWFSGPEGAGWVKAGDEGFLGARRTPDIRD